MNFIAFDFETANSIRSSICSIGLAIVENGKLVESQHLYVKPTPNHYDWFNTMLHGISDEKTKDQKTFKQQWEGLKKYFNKQTLVAHNASFDCSVLRFSLNSSRLAFPDLDYYCTYALSRELLPLGGFRLDDVSKHFKIKLDHHNAESDAIASAQIALRLCEMYEATSLEELSTKKGFKVGKIFSKTKTYQPFSKK